MSSAKFSQTTLRRQGWSSKGIYGAFSDITFISVIIVYIPKKLVDRKPFISPRDVKDLDHTKFYCGASRGRHQCDFYMRNEREISITTAIHWNAATSSAVTQIHTLQLFRVFLLALPINFDNVTAFSVRVEITILILNWSLMFFSFIYIFLVFDCFVQTYAKASYWKKPKSSKSV